MYIILFRQDFICLQFDRIFPFAGLDVATCGVANATRFYSLATNFSRLVAGLAPRFFDFVLKFLIEFNTLILSRSRMKPMKSCSILLLATLFTC